MKPLSRLVIATLLLALLVLPMLVSAGAPEPPASWKKWQLSDAEWQKRLSSEQYRVLRKQGTEIAFTGAYWNQHGKGIYRCAGCGLELFDAHTKFDSGTGWPSFTSPIHATNVHEIVDHALGMERTEVECARCGGHLGHVFDDGPAPTGLRYCINSVSLTFVAAK